MKLPVQSKKKLYKAFFTFLVLAGLFYWLAYSDWFIRAFAAPLAAGISHLVAALLRLLGNDVQHSGTAISQGPVVILINHKCTGIYQFAGYLAAVLAFPVSLKKKAAGIAWGIFCIGTLNLTRIVSIFYIALWWPQRVFLVHDIIWGALMIIFTILAWILWARVKKLQITNPKLQTNPKFQNTIPNRS